MKNLAGVPADISDPIILAELTKAGIQYFKLSPDKHGELNTSYRVCFIEGTGWIFSRAWRYWVAHWEPPHRPITMEQAKELHASHGQDVRSGGHCGAPAPEEQFGADGIPYLYHVDTQEGLNAFVKVIRKNSHIPETLELDIKKKHGTS